MKGSRGEKEAAARTGRSWEQLRKEQKTLQYFTEKEGYFSGFLAFVKFVKFNAWFYWYKFLLFLKVSL